MPKTVRTRRCLLGLRKVLVGSVSWNEITVADDVSVADAIKDAGVPFDPEVHEVWTDSDTDLNPENLIEDADPAGIIVVPKHEVLDGENEVEEDDDEDDDDEEVEEKEDEDAAQEGEGEDKTEVPTGERQAEPQP